MAINTSYVFTRPAKKIQRIAEYRKYILFSATPNQFREKEFGYKTNEGFAKDNHISQRNLMLWRLRDDFWPQVNTAMNAYLKQFTPSVMGAMLKNIENNGDAPEVKLWHQLVEGWSEKTDTSLSMNRESIKALQDANVAIFEAAKKRDKEQRSSVK